MERSAKRRRQRFRQANEEEGKGPGSDGDGDGDGLRRWNGGTRALVRREVLPRREGTREEEREREWGVGWKAEARRVERTQH